MQIALLGTRGVPARYGGFETCVEQVGRRLVEAGHQVRVYCRPSGTAAPSDHLDEYLGMQLIHLPVVRRRSLETIAHTALSMLDRSLVGADAAIVFNAANALLLPLIKARGVPVATHVDGLEWRRGKWGPTGRRFYRVAESLAVRWSDALIADARGIAEYYRDEFDAPTELIAYGAPILTDVGGGRIVEFGVRPKAYHLVVARFEPENHVLEIVRGYTQSNARLPLLVVGAAPYADAYTAEVGAAAAASSGRVRLLGAVWDQDQVDELYANALTYWHGHSVGGTNPSLLRAAGAAASVCAYDVVFNREVLGRHGQYFVSPADVARLVEAAESAVDATRARGVAAQQEMTRYSWDDVADSYEALCRRLANGPRPRSRPTGRRTGLASLSFEPRPIPAEPTSDVMADCDVFVTAERRGAHLPLIR